MPRLIGQNPAASSLAAPGIWTPNEVHGFRRANTWPASTLLLPRMTILHTQYENTLTSAVGPTGTGTNTTFDAANVRFGTHAANVGADGRITYNNTLFRPGTRDFTISMWVRPTSLSTFRIFASRQGASGYNGWYLFLNTNGSITFSNWNASAEIFGLTLASAGSVVINAWHHIVVTRVGNTLNTYVNGVRTSNQAFTHNFGLDVGSTFRIGGGDPYYTTQNLNGQVDEVMVCYGSVYSGANINVPAVGFSSPSALYDPSIESVGLLLPMNGTNGSSAFVDRSSYASSITANGSITQTNSDAKFAEYGTCGSFAGGHLSVPANSIFSFGTGDFTVEGWIKTSVNSIQASASRTLWRGGTNDNQLYLEVGTGKIVWGLGALLSSGSVTDAQWHHVAACRASGTLRLFVDGVQAASAAYGTSVGTSGACLVGAFDGSNGAFSGLMQDFRVTPGVARYTAGFTPPSRMFYDDPVY